MSLRKVGSLLAVVLAALAVVGVTEPASALAATDTGEVTGRVLDSSGAPVPDFAVRLTTGGEDAPYRAYSAATDAVGDFTFTGVAPAAYRVYDDEESWFARGNGWPTLTVHAGATVHEPAVTVLRAATVRGVLVSAADGSPIAGQSVFANGPTATTDEDGSFSLVIAPGTVAIRAGQRFWFDATRTVTLPEGASADLGAIPLDPAGIVGTSLRAGSGRSIDPAVESAVVDGCRVRNFETSTCRGVEPYATVASLQLAPGVRTIRYEVRSPVTRVVRHVTRTVDVLAGAETALPPVVFPVVDPATRATVSARTYRRGHPVVLRVREGSYLDGAKPRLPITVRVSGHVVRPTSLRWRKSAGGSSLLLVTLPTRWSAHRTLKVRVVVHGTAGYAGQTSAAAKLVRAH